MYNIRNVVSSSYLEFRTMDKDYKSGDFEILVHPPPPTPVLKEMCADVILFCGYRRVKLTTAVPP
jgi:hypothetical protein